MKSMAMPHLMPQRQGPHKKIHANVRVFEACFEGKLYRITRTFELGRAGVWSQYTVFVFSDPDGRLSSELYCKDMSSERIR
jgi:hypothetical protein